MTGTMVEPLVLPELTFEEEPHIYRLNGVAIPSVSKLMEPLRNLSYSRVDRKTLEKAAAKGTTVHNSIENWIKFGIDDVPMEHREMIASQWETGPRKTILRSVGRRLET